MPVDYTEHAFETAIEHHLTTAGGLEKGDPEAFDRNRALDPTVLISFIRETQPKEWEYLQNIQKEKAEETLLEDLCKALDSKHEGCLKVLRHGFKCFGKLFRVAYFAPASGLNPEIQKLYTANRLPSSTIPPTRPIFVSLNPSRMIPKLTKRKRRAHWRGL